MSTLQIILRSIVLSNAFSVIIRNTRTPLLPYVVLFWAMSIPAELHSQQVEVCGFVTDLHGIGLHRAEVVEAKSGARAYANQEGRYCLVLQHSDELFLTAKYPGFSAMRQAVKSPQRLDFGLIPGRLTDLPRIRISGNVTDDEGNPISRARIDVRACFGSSASTTAISGSDGSFTAEIADSGQYIVLVCLANYSCTSTVVVVSASESPKAIRTRLLKLH